MKIVFSPLAAEDLVTAHEFISKDSPVAADRVVARIIEVMGLLAVGGMVGREVELRDGRVVRTWPVPPYRLYYRIVGSDMEVARVYHQAREPIER